MLEIPVGASIWERHQLRSLTAGMLRGLRLERLSDVDAIGGGASLTTSCDGVVVKTVSLSYGAERFIHVVGVHGRIEAAQALALVELLALLLDVPADVHSRHEPERAVLFIRCDAASEAGLQNRVSLLENTHVLEDSLAEVLRVS